MTPEEKFYHESKESFKCFMLSIKLFMNRIKFVSFYIMFEHDNMTKSCLKCVSYTLKILFFVLNILVSFAQAFYDFSDYINICAVLR